MVTIEDVHNAYSDTLYIEHFHLVDIPLATYLSKSFGGENLWIRMVAPTGFGKTTMIEPLLKMAYHWDDQKNLATGDNLRYNIFQMSQITSASFASGGRDSPEKDLGSWLENKNSFILVNDLASIQTMDAEAKTSLQGTLRELFDGYIKINTGKYNKHYKGIQTNMLSFCTPQVSASVDTQQILGTREISYIVPPFKDIMKGMNIQDSMVNRSNRCSIVKEFVEEHMDKTAPELHSQTLGLIKHLAIVISRRRTEPVTNFNDELIEHIIEECPMRVCGQLIKLARGLKLMGISDVMVNAYIIDIAKNTGNRLRRDINGLLKSNGVLSVNDIANQLIISPKEIRKQLWSMKHMGDVEPILISPGGKVPFNITDYDTKWFNVNFGK